MLQNETCKNWRPFGKLNLFGNLTSPFCPSFLVWSPPWLYASSVKKDIAVSLKDLLTEMSINPKTAIGFSLKFAMVNYGPCGPLMGSCKIPNVPL